jgi:hypothetical protein
MAGAFPPVSRGVLPRLRLDSKRLAGVRCERTARTKQARAVPSIEFSSAPGVSSTKGHDRRPKTSTAPPDDRSRQVVKAHSVFESVSPRRLVVDRRKRAVLASHRPRHIVAVRLIGGALKAYQGAL